MTHVALNVCKKPLNSRSGCSWSTPMQANCEPRWNSSEDLSGEFSTFHCSIPHLPSPPVLGMHLPTNFIP